MLNFPAHTPLCNNPPISPFLGNSLKYGSICGYITGYNCNYTQLGGGRVSSRFPFESLLYSPTAQTIILVIHTPIHTCMIYLIHG